jgi:O-antigen/teichoic acid export membrane protein
MNFKSLKNRMLTIARKLLAKDTGEMNKGTNRYRKAFRTLSGTYLAQVVTILTGLVTTPLLMAYLGNERYGLMISAVSLFFFFGYLDFGMGFGLQNRISTAYGKQDYETANKYVSSGFVFYIALALSMMILSSIVIPFLPLSSILKVKSPIAILEILPTVLVLSVTVSIGLIAIFAQRLCDSLQEGYLTRVAMVGSRILSLCLVLSGIYFKVGLPILVAFYVIPSIASITAFGILQRKYPWIRPKRDAINFSLIRQTSSTGFHGLFTIISYSAMMSTIPLIISNRIGAEFVIQFSIVNQIVILVTTAINNISLPFWPAITEAISVGDFQWVKKATKRFFVISLSLGLFCSFIFLLFGRFIIKFWTHNDAAVPNISLLISMSLFIILLVVHSNAGTILGGVNRFRGMAIYGSIIAIPTIGCIFLFGPVVGVTGISWILTTGFLIRCICMSIEVSKIMRQDTFTKCNTSLQV